MRTDENRRKRCGEKEENKVVERDTGKERTGLIKKKVQFVQL